MKTLTMALMLMASFTLFGSADLLAQQKKTTTAQDLIQNLQQTSVQEGVINLGSVSVNVSQVTVQDLITVQNVLNNAQIDILNNSLNNITITDVLTNLLRDARILNKNQVIVGVLSNQDRIRFVTQNARSMK